MSIPTGRSVRRDTLAADRLHTTRHLWKRSAFISGWVRQKVGHIANRRREFIRPIPNPVPAPRLHRRYSPGIDFPGGKCTGLRRYCCSNGEECQRLGTPKPAQSRGEASLGHRYGAFARYSRNYGQVGCSAAGGFSIGLPEIPAVARPETSIRT